MATKRRGNGEGSIRQRDNGGWEVRVSTEDGKRQSFYGKTRKEVQDKLRAAQRDLEAGLDLSVGRLTVAQYLEKWLAASVKPSVKVKTYEGYESIVRVRVVPKIGKRLLTKLNPLDLQKLYTDLADAGLSAQSIHHTHRVLHRAFVQAMRWDLIARNPCDGVQAPKAMRTEQQFWTPEQADTFLQKAREHRMHALYALALTTGMRQGELLGLQWLDVDLVGGVLIVRRALQAQRGRGLVFVEPKTARSRRRIELSQTAIAALRAHKDRQAFSKRQACAESADTDLVFCNAQGGPLAPSHQTAVFKAAVVAAGLPPMRFHDMRHTAATILLSKAVHVKQVAEMLGHSTVLLTLNTYSHLIPTMHGDAAAAMDAVFSQEKAG